MKILRQIMKSWMHLTVAFLMVAGGSLFNAAHAEEFDRPNEAGALHSVWVYKLVCYDPMPDKASVEKMASEFGFVPITGSELKAFAPPTPTSYLKAWKVSDYERVFKTAISVAAVNEALAGVYPDFAKGSATGCTVILPGKDDSKAVAAAMMKLTTRKPDETFEAGPFNVSSWTGLTDANVFLIYHYAPKNGKPGGLLSIVTLSK